MNCFSRQGKGLPKYVCEKIIDRWLEGQSQAQISKSLNISKQTFSIRRGNLEAQHGGNTRRTARTDDICLHIEYHKQINPQYKCIRNSKTLG